MKPYLLTLSLFCTACGSGGGHDSPAVSPTPAPQVIETPTPTPDESASLVGNWIDTNKISLVFEKNGNAKSDEQELKYSIDQENQILFSADGVEIDSCGWDILSSGGLTSPLIVTLNLACVKAGALKYTRVR